MRLPEHVEIQSLKQLRGLVDAYQGEDDAPQLEMTKAQYLRYKELIFQADFIRYFDGLEIVIPKEPSTNSEGSV